LNKRKKIISIVIKSLIGLSCALIVYFRLRSDFTPANLTLLASSVFSTSGAISVLVCFLLIPVNWGLESYKWMLTTAPIEKVSLVTAQKSVYSGICVGNLAPGRATEFLAKIIYFKPENRPNISVLHFVNGMFQLSVTYLLGFVALAYKIKSFGEQYMWIAWVTAGIACAIIAVFILSVIKIDKVLHYVTKKFSKQESGNFNYRFTRATIFKLFFFSVLRYSVFLFQMLLLINLFQSGIFTADIILSVVLYFLITTTIPMISVIEPAIRAAVALVVFSNTGLSNTAMALASVSVWLVNIILPSIAGYIFLLEQNFDFSFGRSKA
jgi:hypothetical protein